MRDHGGNLDWAIRRHGGTAAAWIDLSTGINRLPYPLPELPATAWTALPTREAMGRLIGAARGAYGTGAPMLALAGAQAAIQLIPQLSRPTTARVLAPTYNEHAGALRASGWQVQEVATLQALRGAELAIVVNPNNPDGRVFTPGEIMDLAGQVGRLVVDESFADPTPERSVAAFCGGEGLIVLRSFGKFYGLAGLRLGFAIGSAADIGVLESLAGPWPVSGVAIEIGAVALQDRDWSATTIARLADDAARLDGLAWQRGWQLAGGTALFRLYDTADAAAAQESLARRQVWSRIFPYSSRWIRLGLPGNPAEWARVDAAMRG